MGRMPKRNCVSWSYLPMQLRDLFVDYPVGFDQGEIHCSVSNRLYKIRPRTDRVNIHSHDPLDADSIKHFQLTIQTKVREVCSYCTRQSCATCTIESFPTASLTFSSHLFRSSIKPEFISAGSCELPW